MPRPPRRTRAVSSRTATAATKEPESDRVAAAAASAAAASTASTAQSSSSRAPSASSDVYGVSDRELTRRASLRQAATTTAARQAAEPTAAAATTASARRLSRRSSAAAATPTSALRARLARGHDASGLDVMDDTFADLDTNFGDHDLGDLDDDLDAFDGLGGLDSSSPVAPAHTTATATADSTSSSFNVGLFRRGRPRQSSVHSREDAPIRPSSRGPATPSISSSFSLGAFKRRAREPSILGRRRDASRASHISHASRTSRPTSRDRSGLESGSELDTAAGPASTSDTELSAIVASRNTRTRRSARATNQASSAAEPAADAAAAAHAPDASMASAGNSTSMLLMARTRTRGAAAPRKRKSEEGQREDELPKRRATGTPSGGGVLQSVEAEVEATAEPAASSSPPLSSPPSLPMSDADRRRYTTPGGPDDEVMAPPMSSDSESESPPLWPSLKALAAGVRRGKATTSAAAGAGAAVLPSLPLSRQTPDLVDDDDASNISSPPSLTHSPNYRPAAAAAAAAASKTKGKASTNVTQPKDVVPLTTAALAALLPQRHRRGRSGHRTAFGGNDDDADADADADGNELERSALLSEDDDELAHMPNRRGAGLRRGRSAARSAAGPVAPDRAPLSANRRQATTATTTTTPTTAAGKKARRRTYGSRSFSDKENQDTTAETEPGAEADESSFSPLPDNAFEDETTQVAPPTARTARFFGEELEKAARKFKEVDQWTLEFESVSRSSSPVGAR